MENIMDKKDMKNNMENNGSIRKVNDKKKNSTRNIVVFLAIMLVSMAAGFILGAGIAYGKKHGLDFKEILNYINGLVMSVLPAIYIGLSVVSFLTAFIIYRLYSRHASVWDGDDEKEIDKIEAGLGCTLAIANSMMIFNVLLFSMHVWNTLCRDDLSGAGYQLFGVIIFIFNYAWIVVISRLVVELEKRLNPEKKGDFLETNFSKKWEDSCDEAQKMIIYEAGYRAYRAGTRTCTLIWLISFVCMFMLDTGLMPIFIVCIIWFVMMIRYTIEADKLERKMYR